MPTRWMCLIALTQVFIFRSGSVNDNWIHIYNLVEEVIKKFKKYDFFML